MILIDYLLYYLLSTFNRLMKSKPSGKEIMINPELRKAIMDILSKTPQIDAQKMTQTIVGEKKVPRLPRDVIKNGVESYYRVNQLGVKAPQPEKRRSIVDLDIDQKPIKKIKKNEFIIQFQDNQSYSFNNLGGIKSLLQQLQTELFSIFLKESSYKALSKLPPNRGFLICGSPGAGKTLLANCILSYLSKLQLKKVNAFSVSSLDLLSGDAEDKLRKIFQAAEEKAPSVIFFDNLQELCNKDNNKRMQSLPSLSLYSWINSVKDKQIYIIGASSAPQKLDFLTKPGLFYKQIKINNPDEEQRTEIIQKMLEFYNHNVSEHLKEMSLMTAGYMAIDIVSLFKEAVIRRIERSELENKQKIIQAQAIQQQTMKDEKKQEQFIIEIQDVRRAFLEVQPILKKDGFAKIPNVKMEDVGALQDIKQSLYQEIIMPLKEQDKFRSMNFEVSGGGILLYGPPGCGKTMIAKAIANQAKANFITVKGPELLTKYVGQSQEAVRKVFDRARLSAPCIIFFDQFDALAPKRQDQGNQVTERVVNTLLNELNGVDDRRMVFVIAATNRPDIIDEAVLRSGRIEKHLYVPLPKEKQRYDILLKITRKVNHNPELGLDIIAAKTDNFSGADLYFLVKKAIISAVSNNRPKIEALDLMNALQNYKKDKYNKGNRLKLSQYAEQRSQDNEKPEENDNNNDIFFDDASSLQIKKQKSVMELQVNTPRKKNYKTKASDNLLNSFIEHLLKAAQGNKKEE